MIKVKAGGKVITIVPALDVYGNISIVKPVFKVITIEPSADALSVCALKEVQRLGINPFVQTIRGVLFNKSNQLKML